MRVKISAGVCCHVGNVRSNNEDNFYLQRRLRRKVEQRVACAHYRGSPGAFLCAVADGMGGEQRGELASLMAVKALRPAPMKRARQAATQSVKRANEAICARMKRAGGRMGSTLTALYIAGGSAMCANVGDSRIYLLRAGKLTRLTRDHSKAQVLIDLHVLTPEQARGHSSQHELTRHLGIRPEEATLEPDLSPAFALREGDCFLLCSDGLYDGLTDAQIEAALAADGEPETLAKALVEQALDAGSRDNVTALVIKINRRTEGKNMDISYYKKYEPVFGVWTIKEKIGEGSYGTVFELEREDFGRVYKAALKAITIPKSDSEIIGARAEGMDEESLRAHFQSIAKDMVDEFAILNLLKGNSNVVSYENHQVIRHEDGIGWDILIQMELLTPLNTYAVDNTITRRDVIRLGIDLCKALELCQKYGVMHRDVKPENIFVSANGDFKLGDFGIARKMEKHAGSVYSRKGTNAYMAPEVFKEEPYDSTVDIYSLGIVMYRLLNGKRTPFLPHAPANITAKDRENALMMRMSGKPLPKPIHAEGRLAEIVLKACAYNPRDRYSSPGEMRRELEAILYSNAERPFIYPTGDDLPQDSYPSTGKKKNDTPQTGDEKVDVPNEKPEDAPVVPEAVPEDEPEQEGTHSGYDDEPAWEDAVEPEDRTHSGYDDESAWEPVSEDSGDKAPGALDHVPAWEDVKDDAKHAESADVMPWDEISPDGQDTPESKPADDVPAAHTPKSPLLTGDLRSGFIRMALPLVLAMMASALPGFLEAAMRAAWGSLTAFEVVNQCRTLIWALGISVALGVLKLLPGKLEEGDEAGAHAVIRCAIGLDLILGVAFVLISFLMRGAVSQYIGNMYGNSGFYAFNYWFYVCLFALSALLELLFVSLLFLSGKPMLAALPPLAEAVLGCGGLILVWFGSQYGSPAIVRVGTTLGRIAQIAAALLGLFLNLRYNKEVPLRRRGGERQPGAMAALVRACALPLLATISLCLFASVVRCLFGNDDRAYLAASSYSFLQSFMTYPVAALGMVGVCFMACLTAANRSEGRITVLRQIRNLGLASIGLGAVLIFFMAGATIRTLPEEDVAFFIVPLLCMTVTMLCALCLDAVGRARVAAVLAAAQLIIAAPGILGVSVGYIAGFSIEFAMLVVPSVVSMALLYRTSKKLTDMTE